MSKFLSRDFLLTTKTAKKLYFEHAERMPIIDYHCHVSPKEIYEDKQFSNLTELWLGGDHYKWRMMRADGIDEYYITGDAPAYEKFLKFAEALPRAIGNPMYHWCHLELKKYFGYTGVLNGETAKDVWELAQKKLAEGGLSVRRIIEQSGVCFIGTTDDPIDTLEYHKRLRDEGKMKTVVAPSFRPDKALNMEKDGWRDYIARLSEVSDIAITDLASLKEALRRRIEHFAENGCRASDHGLDFVVYAEADAASLDAIVKRALSGEAPSASDAAAVKTELLLFCAAEYAKRGWVMQLHFDCLRNPNSKMLERLGPDSGFDCIGTYSGRGALARLLDRLYAESILPRTVLYSLDPTENAFLGTLIGAFGGDGIRGKIQHGSAWWFNDNKVGMREQMTSLANLGLLGNFIGMLTDSRSFLSYTRHEYFRRILCSLIGEWVENGEYPSDEKALGALVEDICYYNASRYFKLNSEE